MEKGWHFQEKDLGQLDSYMKKNLTLTSHHTPKSIHVVSRFKCLRKNSMFLEGNRGECPCRQIFLKQDSNSTNHKEN